MSEPEKDPEKKEQTPTKDAKQKLEDTVVKAIDVTSQYFNKFVSFSKDLISKATAKKEETKPEVPPAKEEKKSDTKPD